MIQAWESGGTRSQQRGEELEPAPEPGPQHVVGCSFREFADQHLMLALRCQLQLDEAGRGREGYEVDVWGRFGVYHSY